MRCTERCYVPRREDVAASSVADNYDRGALVADEPARRAGTGSPGVPPLARLIETLADEEYSSGPKTPSPKAEYIAAGDERSEVPAAALGNLTHGTIVERCVNIVVVAGADKWSPRDPADRGETAVYIPLVTAVRDSSKLSSFELAEIVVARRNDHTAAGGYDSEALMAVLEPIHRIPRIVPVAKERRAPSARTETGGTDHLH